MYKEDFVVMKNVSASVRGVEMIGLYKFENLVECACPWHREMLVCLIVVDNTVHDRVALHQRWNSGDPKK